MCVRGEHIGLRIVAVMSKLRRPALLLAKRLTVNLASLISRHGAVTHTGDGHAVKSAPPIFAAAKTSARFEPGRGTVNPMFERGRGPTASLLPCAVESAHSSDKSPLHSLRSLESPRGNQLPPF
jgi:hypothetical protein